MNILFHNKTTFFAYKFPYYFSVNVENYYIFPGKKFETITN